MDELPLLVGSGDIARALGVTRQAVDHRLRSDPAAPAAAGVVNRTSAWNGTRIWWREDVDRWLNLEPDRWHRLLASTVRGG
ncbi:hypothetical protein UG55_100336 [Frankia sp. EI5c]|uniref:Uncharacterized protein n=1 Tax=Parafrankia irregularis TaxID=795642 RepID=A0A0S4QLN5_9ACTN|nr:MULTISPECIES: hypothetical protein [Frankiaceae]KPM51659.1 hypothetical protein ACG83_32985 [Frankia sp. R43]MBE3201199.1 hypothetical protein [Parafrankia sp. CH37]OAA29225.1 hypothetical protein UG55_100336 [Frankia sp. EI5c]ONH59281.1 hypothetical protein CcI49_17710 [Frankia sp. CcI49]CUU56365.1 hypothetical protein Ga0074812_107249 [Parafrankia irregularis]